MKKKKVITEPMIEVAKRVKRIRNMLDLTQKEMAKQLCISTTTFVEVEKYKYKPNFKFLFNIGKTFHVNLYYLVYGEGEMFFDPINPFYKAPVNPLLKDDDIRKFMYQFENSKVVRYLTLVNFRKISETEKEIIEKEVAEAKANQRK